jgi:hypothetical protein
MRRLGRSIARLTNGTVRARVTGLPRPDAGRGNRALVADGYATMPAPGLYQLASCRALEEAGFSATGAVTAEGRRPTGMV